MSTTAIDCAPVTLDIASMPVLTKTAEQARAELTRYAAAMAAAGKTPRQIHLRPSQFRSIVSAVEAARKRTEASPPPVGGLVYLGVPVLPWAPQGEEEDE